MHGDDRLKPLLCLLHGLDDAVEDIFERRGHDALGVVDDALLLPRQTVPFSDFVDAFLGIHIGNLLIDSRNPVIDIGAHGQQAVDAGLGLLNVAFQLLYQRLVLVLRLLRQFLVQPLLIADDGLAVALDDGFLIGQILHQTATVAGQAIAQLSGIVFDGADAACGVAHQATQQGVEVLAHLLYLVGELLERIQDVGVFVFDALGFVRHLGEGIGQRNHLAEQLLTGLVGDFDAVDEVVEVLFALWQAVSQLGELICEIANVTGVTVGLTQEVFVE